MVMGQAVWRMDQESIESLPQQSKLLNKDLFLLPRITHQRDLSLYHLL